MEIPLFLAVSPEEMAVCINTARNIAWMGCHFSKSEQGQIILPENLPKNSFLIVEDSVPIPEHNTSQIASQLHRFAQAFHCKGVLLDFQRPVQYWAKQIVRELLHTLPCPVGVSEPYAHGLNCPVFLPPIPPTSLPEDSFRPWQGREIWLDISYSPMQILITSNGSTTRSVPLQEYHLPHLENRLFCHYGIRTENHQVVFDLKRTATDISALLKKCATYGVTYAFGLYQELGDDFH